MGNVSKLDVPPVLWDVCQAVGSLCRVQADEVVSHSQYVTGLLLNSGLSVEPGLLPHTVCSSEMRSPPGEQQWSRLWSRSCEVAQREMTEGGGRLDVATDMKGGCWWQGTLVRDLVFLR